MIDSVEVRVGDLIEDGTLEIGDGYRVTLKELGDSGFPFVRAADLFNGRIHFEDLQCVPRELHDRVASKLSQPGDVVITTKGTVGCVAVVGEDDPQCVYSPQLSFWRVKDQSMIVPRFLRYWLQSPEFTRQMGMYKGQTSMADYLSLTDQKRVQISLPSLPIQRRIAGILGALDDKIEVNRRINRTLEEMAQTLYKHWFVDFGPFQAGGFVDSELGDVPAGWEVKPLKEVCKLTMGLSPKSKYYNEDGEGLPFHQGVTDFGHRFPTHRRYCTVTKRVANPGDILFSVRAPVGRINIADRKLVIGRGVASINRKDGCNSFQLYQLKSIFKEEDSMGSGTIFASVTKKDLQNLKLITPPDDVIRAFEEQVCVWDEQIANNVAQNKVLAETRDYLLPKLLSGEVEVPAAETAVGETEHELEETSYEQAILLPSARRTD